MRRREVRGRLVTERIETVRRLLAERTAAGALLRTRRNFAWLTVGGVNHVLLSTEGGAAPLLVTGDDAVVLAPVNEAARIAVEEVVDLPLDVAPVPWEVDDIEREAVRRAGGAVLSDVDLEETLLPIRAVLAPFEHERLQRLGDAVRRAAEEALRTVEAGANECGVGADAGRLLAAEGCRLPVVLVAADERVARYRHPLPSGRTIDRRVMLVLVAERWGLHAAITRFVEIDAPDPELQRRLDATSAIEATMRNASRPGRTLGDVLSAAQAAYAEHGFPDEWRLHHQGGLIGYQARERVATPGDATLIQPGMAFAWNPSITGAKAESTFYLDADGRPVVVTEGAFG